MADCSFDFLKWFIIVDLPLLFRPSTNIVILSFLTLIKSVRLWNIPIFRLLLITNSFIQNSIIDYSHVNLQRVSIATLLHSIIVSFCCMYLCY